MTLPTFRNIGFSDRYRSDKDDVVRDLYGPCLSIATQYCRAVGYFTSTSLALLSRGLDLFTDRGGTIKLVASPRLELDDIVDIERGYQVREVIQRAMLRALDSEMDSNILRGLGVLGRLIAAGQLDIKLAFLLSGDRIGLYHEKIGYFRDPNGNVIAFSGSANETYGGLLINFESLDVYRSWVPGDEKRTLRIVNDFDQLWKAETLTLEVTPFPDVARDRLIEIAKIYGSAAVPARDRALVEGSTVSLGSPKLIPPPSFRPRPYQSAAIRAWLGNQGRGILKMATGTGKTKTALAAAAQIVAVHSRRDQPVVVVVVAPYIHLVDQWVDSLREFGSQAIAVYEASQAWVPQVEDALAQLRFGRAQVAVMVATIASFGSDVFQSFLGRIKLPLLFIGDEVHNLGSRRLGAILPANATYRLGLSATPERFMDEEGTQVLVDYFGKAVFEMDLRAAIDAGALCHYRYHPRLVELTDQEMILYQELTVKIATLINSQGAIDDALDDSVLGLLLRKRAGVLGHAAGKLGILQRDLDRHKDDWFQLVYCAEGRRPSSDESDAPGDRQIEQCLRLIGQGMQLTAHAYVSDTARDERRALLRRFQTGNDLRFLVAMRCLDEGVDIPNARVAYLLASSANPRQFIQRRGRLLRNAPGKSGAIIYDYLAIPQGRFGDATSNTERQLVRREMERAVEFSSLSDNYAEALTALRPLKQRFGLMDL